MLNLSAPSLTMPRFNTKTPALRSGQSNEPNQIPPSYAPPTDEEPLFAFPSKEQVEASQGTGHPQEFVDLARRMFSSFFQGDPQLEQGFFHAVVLQHDAKVIPVPPSLAEKCLPTFIQQLHFAKKVYQYQQRLLHRSL